MARAPVFPFTAIVGQEDMKLALLLAAIEPGLGGVLIRGEKGTGKSTAVRALAALLPDLEVVAGCPCNCDPADPSGWCPWCRQGQEAGALPGVARRPVPVVELPLSATEDRVVGSLDLEEAMRSGRRRFEPGLLARAHRGILYVDEINLLPDHLVDILLDVAASGVNVVEREGISLSHPARFVLVGTMNPEEGELRPGLLDRFGLACEVRSIGDPLLRAALMRRREEFDADPRAFLAAWREREEQVRTRLARARVLVRQVVAGEGTLDRAVQIARQARVAGHRAEITMVLAARAWAAWEGRPEATPADVDRVAPFVLAHRQRAAGGPRARSPERPAETSGAPEHARPRAEHGDHEHGDHEDGGSGDPRGGGADRSRAPGGEEPSPGEVPFSSSGHEQVFGVGEPFTPRRIEHGRDRQCRRGTGRRSRSYADQKAGRYVRAILPRGTGDLALDATLRAAAPRQAGRSRPGLAVVVESADLREKLRETRVRNLLLFVVDASGSMGVEQRMVAAKGAVFSLLLDAYHRRDLVAMIAFRQNGAQLVLPPTRSVEVARKRLADLPTGGRTPLAAGLLEAYRLVREHLERRSGIMPLCIIITDGRANVGLGGGDPVEDARRVAHLIRRDARVDVLVVDVERPGMVSFRLARELAQALGAAYARVDELPADSLTRKVAQWVKWGE